MRLSYIQNTLAANEEVINDFPQTKWQYAVHVVLVLFFGLGLLTGFICWLKRNTTEFAFTTKRVIIKRGIIARDTFEMQRSKIESIDVKQGILDRIIGSGNIIVTGTGGKTIVFNEVADINSIRTQLAAYTDE